MLQVDLKQHFGSIPKSMVTLIQFFSDDGGISGFQRPVGEIWPWAWLYFIAFLIIVTIGLLQLLSAVFVGAILEEKKDKERRTLKKEVS